MIKLTTELQPGKIFYHVNGSNRTKTADGDFCKMIVTSPVYDVNLRNRKSPFFNVIVEYASVVGVTSYNSDRSANDMGIFNPGESRDVFNLNRSFWKKEEAEAFIKELQADKFSDADDQAYAERLTARQHFMQQAEWFDDFWDED